MVYFVFVKPLTAALWACEEEAELFKELYEKKQFRSNSKHKQSMSKKQKKLVDADRGDRDDGEDEDNDADKDFGGGTSMNFSWWQLFMYKYCRNKNKYLDLAYYNLNKEVGLQS